MPCRTTVLVLGGGAAGMSAASKARRIDPTLDVVVVNKDKYVAYGACGIPYLVAGWVRSPEALLAYPPKEFEKRGIRLLLNCDVVSLNTRLARAEILDRETGVTSSVAYDHLVFATGASPLQIIPKPHPKGVFSVRTLSDAIQILSFIEERQPRRAIIVGSGPIGLEMAEALRARGLEVILVERLPEILPGFSSPARRAALDQMGKHGITLIAGEGPIGVEGNEHVSGLVLPSQTIATDLVILSAGIKPNSDLAASLGLKLGICDAISVDEQMLTSAEGIYAAGDCATVHHLITGTESYLPRGTTANKQGRVAGENVAGGCAVFPGVLGTTVFKFFELEFARVGLNEKEASQAGFDVQTVSIRSRCRANYYPGSRPVEVMLTVERSGKILGGEMVGTEIAKRIDVLAVAIHSQLTVEELSHLDLSYAPPFAPVYDPVLLAGMEACKALRSGTRGT